MSNTREDAILSLAPQVRYWASRFKAKTPNWIAYEDLESEAWIGAIKAVDRFEQDRGFKLATFADARIRGQVLDYLRSQDWLSRAERRKVKALETEASGQHRETPLSLEVVGEVPDHGNRSIKDATDRAEIDLLCRRLTRKQVFVVRSLCRDMDHKEIARAAGIKGKVYSASFASATLLGVKVKLGLRLSTR